MHLGEWQKQVDQWIQQYGVRYFDIKTNTLLLVEEVGELSRLIARQYGEQSFKESMTEQETKKAISDELGDILFVATCIANQLEIDIETILSENLTKKTRRDGQRHIQNKKLN